MQSYYNVLNKMFSFKIENNKYVWKEKIVFLLRK